MSGTWAQLSHMTDYMGLEGLISAEALLVRKTAREFINREVLPIIEEHAGGLRDITS